MKINPTIQGATKHWRELLPNIRFVAGQAARAAFVAGLAASRQPSHEPATQQPMKISGDGFGANLIVELTIQLATDAQVQALNAEFRGKDKPTNVLSFPSGEWPSVTVTPGLSRGAEMLAHEAGCRDEPGMTNTLGANGLFLGDIILARETVAREALAQEKTFQAHFIHLVVHGTLHLMGYDHEENDEAEEMEAIEIEVLSSLAIANPYLLP